MQQGPRWITVGLFALLGGAGCASPKNADMLHFLREREHKVSAIEYRIGIPDTVAITAPRALEINGEVQRLQPDGKINLRLLGQVKVFGELLSRLPDFT